MSVLQRAIRKLDRFKICDYMICDFRLPQTCQRLQDLTAFNPKQT